MTHRALVERDVATGTDRLGHRAPPSWATHIEALPCWFYVSVGRQAITETAVATLETPRLLVPKGTDIKEQDRINGITDRQGGVVYGGLLNIESIIPAHDHLELVCSGVGIA